MTGGHPAPATRLSLPIRWPRIPSQICSSSRIWGNRSSLGCEEGTVDHKNVPHLGVEPRRLDDDAPAPSLPSPSCCFVLRNHQTAKQRSFAVPDPGFSSEGGNFWRAELQLAAGTVALVGGGEARPRQNSGNDGSPEPHLVGSWGRVGPRTDSVEEGTRASPRTLQSAKTLKFSSAHRILAFCNFLGREPRCAPVNVADRKIAKGRWCRHGKARPEQLLFKILARPPVTSTAPFRPTVAIFHRQSSLQPQNLASTSISSAQPRIDRILEFLAPSGLTIAAQRHHGAPQDPASRGWADHLRRPGETGFSDHGTRDITLRGSGNVAMANRRE